MKKYDKYISTTLPYANSVPHIGHALEFIQAYVLKKFFEGQGEKVFLNIGVDEHGLKVYTKARELGVDTKKYLDELTLTWLDFCKKFEIEADNFYRTTNPAHHEMVKRYWNKCVEKGDLYKKKYVGQYCVGCESFKTDADLVDGKCPDHNAVPAVIEEENWFFRVSKYRDKLIAWLDYNTEFLSPASKTEELRNIILGAEDVSVSRLKKNVPWGVEVPGDQDQVIYVWFEALLNYVFAVEDFDSENFIQLCGPDNLRFQGSLFQAILESGGHKHTNKLLVHGTVLDADGNKMSKTLGNVVDPIEQLGKYGLDAVRYYALAGLSTYGNGCWSEKDLVASYNSDLADNFGNLLARTLHLIDKKDVKVSYVRNEFKKDVDDRFNRVVELWRAYEINAALRETSSILKHGNKYINDAEPWSKNAKLADVEIVLDNLHYLLLRVSELYQPVLSAETNGRIIRALESFKKDIIFPKK